MSPCLPWTNGMRVFFFPGSLGFLISKNEENDQRAICKNKNVNVKRRSVAGGKRILIEHVGRFWGTSKRCRALPIIKQIGSISWISLCKFDFCEHLQYGSLSSQKNGIIYFGTKHSSGRRPNSAGTALLRLWDFNSTAGIGTTEEQWNLWCISHTTRPIRVPYAGRMQFATARRDLG